MKCSNIGAIFPNQLKRSVLSALLVGMMIKLGFREKSNLLGFCFLNTDIGGYMQSLSRSLFVEIDRHKSSSFLCAMTKGGEIIDERKVRNEEIEK